MTGATYAVMEVLGCRKTYWAFFREEGREYPDVCAVHTAVWDLEHDLCEVAQEAAFAALGLAAL